MVPSAPKDAFPTKSLIAALVASCLMGSLVPFILHLAAAQSNTTLDQPFITAAVVGPLSVLVSGSLGLGAFFMIARDDRQKLPAAIMACAGIRLFVGLGLGFALYTALALPKAAFWQSFLVAGVLVLIVETLIMNRYLPRHAVPLASKPFTTNSGVGGHAATHSAGETLR